MPQLHGMQRSSPHFAPSVSPMPTADFEPRLTVSELLAGRSGLARMSREHLELGIRVTRPRLHGLAHNCDDLFLLSESRQMPTTTVLQAFTLLLVTFSLPLFLLFEYSVCFAFCLL